MPAGDIMPLVGKEIWDQYFKFCFERNPWDRVISLYYWRYNPEQPITISEFIDSGALNALKRKGMDIYSIEGKIAVDKICRFENLAEELKNVCNNHLNINKDIELPKVKSSSRKDKRHYREILNNDEREKIAEMFRQEIALFGYEY